MYLYLNVSLIIVHYVLVQTKRQEYEQNVVTRRASLLGKVSDKGVFSPRIYSTCTVSTSWDKQT